MSKVTLWSRSGELMDRKIHANASVEFDGLLHLDAAGIGAWLVEALASYSGLPIEYVIPVGHGATIACMVDDALAFPPLDYEQQVPEAVMSAYRRERDSFFLTGSPALPNGLNAGAQLFWLERLHPEKMSNAQFLPWAQYWTWFLSGQSVSEMTSLGCHTDLWWPAGHRFSEMATRMGWAGRFAPMARAGDVVGTLRPDIVRATGLPATTKVLAGLHDSNAALLAARGFSAVSGNDATVLSTGTWFIGMRLTDAPVEISGLPKDCDCLVNVDVFGNPVLSARFMGGREIETLIGVDTRRVDIKHDQPALLAAVDQIVLKGAMLLPTFAPGFGPFPNSTGRWVKRPEDWFARRAAACLYAALVADVSLDLIGSQQCLVVEGRFTEAEVFVRALASLRPGTRVYTANAHHDVSFGALRLIDPGLTPQGQLRPVEQLATDLAAYRILWRIAADQGL